MKTLILIISVTLLFGCEKWEKDCVEYSDIRGDIIKTCCASGPEKRKERKLCECEKEWLEESGAVIPDDFCK